jgi:hypothetical protein
MRRLPHQGAKHGTVGHGDASDGILLLLPGCHGRTSTSSSTCGCILQLERSFSRMISLLSFLSSLWTASHANGSLSLSANGGSPTYLGLQHLHAQEMEGRTATLADRPRPILTRFSHLFTPMGPLDILHFAPFNYIIWTTSSSHHLVSSHEVRSFTLQSSGMFLWNTLVLATFGSDFIMLSNTNGTPHLLL